MSQEINTNSINSLEELERKIAEDSKVIISKNNNTDAEITTISGTLSTSSDTWRLVEKEDNLATISSPVVDGTLVMNTTKEVESKPQEEKEDYSTDLDDDESNVEVPENYEAPVASLESMYDDLMKENKGKDYPNFLLNSLEGIRKELASSNTRKEAATNILASLPKANLNELTIVDNSANPLEIEKSLDVIKVADISTATPVIALKSAYRATMSAMTNSEKLVLRNAKGTTYDQSMTILKVVYNKIQSSSLGKLSFKDFLKVTAEEDYETLVYGIYNSTYPKAVEYKFTCPHCKTVLTVPVESKHLLQVLNVRDSIAHVNEIIANHEQGREYAAKNSMLSKTERIELDNSRLVVELKTPSLENMLRYQQVAAANNKAFSEDVLATIRYIKGIYVPNVELYRSTGKLTYSAINDNTGLLNLVNSLSSADAKQLRKAIAGRNNKYRVDYRIASVNCSNNECNKIIERVDIDMTELLFTGIVEDTVL